MSDYILDINNLSYKTIHGQLNNLNLKVRYGEIHVLLIKTRSEQDTLIEALGQTTAIFPDQNIIKYKGELLTNKTINKISILQQFPQLIEEFTANENINFTTFPTSKFIPFIKWKKTNERSKQLIETLNFSINLDEKVKKLSENERKAVYIARIMLENPDFIIMQEPLEGLSLHNNDIVHNIIKQYQEQGGTILYITKRWEEALKIADQISIFLDGKVIDQLPVDIAIKDPRKLLTKMEGYDYITDSDTKKDNTQKVLEAVFNAAEFLSSEYELNDVLIFLAKEIKTILQADGCSIKLIDESTGSEINNFVVKDDDNLFFQLKEDSINQIAKETSIYYSNANDKSFYNLFTEIDNIKTFIAVPIFVRNQITGIIQVYYESLYVYSDDEFKYLTTLAKHTAIAIEDTRLMGRSTFLNESHHRIKNNLQSIVGLISLQRALAKKNSDISLDDTLNTIIDQIKSIASVHELLAKGNSGRSIINVKDIISSVIALLDKHPTITINLDLDDLFISYNKATSIALITNELVTNCFKHAFKEIDYGTITVQCKRIVNMVYLTVCDDGVGFSQDEVDANNSSLGLSIIRGIVQNDFNGNIEFINTDTNCTKISLSFDTLFND